ncbi:MAG: hypothetical protein SGCHY_002132 [Lobulomycetales sp.]
MITGDNANTACYIARESGMIYDGPDLRSGNANVVLADLKSERVEWRMVNCGDSAEEKLVVSEGDLHDMIRISRNGGKQVELAVTGKAFNALRSKGKMDEYLLDTRIFARMSPEDKVNCVKMHMEHAVTAMCGDGGNDAGALKASHCGIALSDAESSVVSHFSSSFKSIKACVELIREARCSLDVSFASYKNLVALGESVLFLTFIQFYFSVNMDLSYGDIGAFFMGAHDGPTSREACTYKTYREATRYGRPFLIIFVGWETMASVLSQLVISLIFLIVSVILLFSQEFFKCNEFDGSLVDIREWWTLADNYETATTGMIGAFQIVHLSATYNLGSTYRRGFLKNPAFLAMYTVFAGILSIILLADPNPLGCIFRINCGTAEALERQGYSVPPFFVPDQYISSEGHNVFPMYFRVTLFCLTLVNLVVMMAFEKFVVLGPVRSYLNRTRPLERIQLKQ